VSCTGCGDICADLQCAACSICQHTKPVQIHDQGIVNTDPRFIYVPYEGVNMIPTDVRGLTFNRTPQMAINILTLGAKDGKGGFFPKGILGKINTPEGYLKQADGKADWPKCPAVAVEQSAAATGEIMPPITGPGMTVPGATISPTLIECPACCASDGDKCSVGRPVYISWVV
jgi:hypothetical protein